MVGEGGYQSVGVVFPSQTGVVDASQLQTEASDEHLNRRLIDDYRNGFG